MLDLARPANSHGIADRVVSELAGLSTRSIPTNMYRAGGDQDATKARYLPFHEDEDVSIRSADSGQLLKGRVQRVRVLRYFKNHKSVAQWMFQVRVPKTALHE